VKRRHAVQRAVLPVGQALVRAHARQAHAQLFAGQVRRRTAVPTATGYTRARERFCPVTRRQDDATPSRCAWALARRPLTEASVGCSLCSDSSKASSGTIREFHLLVTAFLGAMNALDNLL